MNLSPTLVETLDLLIVMVHAKEKTKSSRRTKEIVEIESVDPKSGKAITLKSFNWLPASDTYENNAKKSQLIRRISFEKGISYEKLEQELEDRTKILRWMMSYNIKEFEEVGEMINLYYKDRDTVMEWVKKNSLPVFSGRRRALEESATGLKIIKE
jgi:hypothetical protein